MKQRLVITPQYSDITPISIPGSDSFIEGGDLPTIPSDLEEELRDWNRVFLDDFDPVSGWTSKDQAERQQEAAFVLKDKLTEAIGDDYIIDVATWF
ncbi:hypothetical protein ACTXJG_16890 [Glutamicibacter arilaitensis]|uniref:hypothetical protein n=1 Tax=Glutamicibacter arilaitensis TaxID=256701 RepID=UPI003FD444A2